MCVMRGLVHERISAVLAYEGTVSGVRVEMFSKILFHGKALVTMQALVLSGLVT